MEAKIESILIYSVAALLCIIVVGIYLYKKYRESRIAENKIKKAQEEGLHEPVSLHPFIDVNRCIQTGACISACPEKDILGIVNGKAALINASQCVGHGACFHACPTEAISLRIGTEKRGVDLPHVNANFETNVPGIYIAGELGGMGLIRNAVEQGKMAVENIAKSVRRTHNVSYDLIIVGAGPAGISASLTAKKLGLKFSLLEQDTLGGTVFTFPRKKIVMTKPMELPLYGKVELYETSKTELLVFWQNVLLKNNIMIRENSKVDSILSEDNIFRIIIQGGEELTCEKVILAIGRRGTPRKLDVPGESKEKVAYRLIEPELINGKNILIVGGGDSAIESALMLADNNQVTVSYRGDVFNRLKPANSLALANAMANAKLDVRLGTNLTLIEDDTITLTNGKATGMIILQNDLVFIFAGGELPIQFLEKTGITITRKFGETVLKH